MKKQLQKLLIAPEPRKSIIFEGRTAQELESEVLMATEFAKIGEAASFSEIMRMYDTPTFAK